MSDKIPSPHPVRDFFLRVSCLGIIGFATAPIWQIVLNHQNSIGQTVAPEEPLTQLGCQTAPKLISLEQCKADIEFFGWKALKTTSDKSGDNFLAFNDSGSNISFATVLKGFTRWREIKAENNTIKLTQSIKGFDHKYNDGKPNLTATGELLITTATCERDCTLVVFDLYKEKGNTFYTVSLKAGVPTIIMNQTYKGYGWKLVSEIGLSRVFVVEPKQP